MGATKIGEDEWTETWQNEDGTTLSVAKPVAQKIWGNQHLPAASGSTAPPAPPEPVAADLPDLSGLGATPPGATPLPPAPEPVPGPPSVPPAAPPPPVEQAPVVQPAGTIAPAVPEPVVEAPAGVPGEAEPISAEDVPGEMRAFARKAQAIKSAAEAARAAADEAATAQANAETEIASIDEKAAQKAEADRQRIEIKRQEKAAAVKKYNDHEIEQGRWWHDRSTGQKVLAGIGVALAGLGMALKGRGGENPALDMIMKAINEDVRMQMADREKLAKNIDTTAGEADDAIADAARNAANMATMRAAAIDRVQRKVGWVRDRLKDEEKIAAATGLMGDLELERVDRQNEAVRYEQAAEERRAKLAHDMATDRQRIAQGWAGIKQRQNEFGAEMNYKWAALGAQREAEKAKLAKDMDDKSRERAVWMVKNDEGQPWLAPTPKAAEDVNKTIESAQGAADVIDRLVELRRESGMEWGALNSSARQEMANLHTNLLMSLKNMHDLGALQEADRAIMEDMIGKDPAGLYSNISRLKSQHKKLIDGVNTKLRNRYGYKGDRWTPEKVTEFDAPLTENERLSRVTQFNPSASGEEVSGAASKTLGAITGIPGVQVKKKHLRALSGANAVTDSVAGKTLKAQQESVAGLLRNALAGDMDAREKIGRIRAQDTPIGKWTQTITPNW